MNHHHQTSTTSTGNKEADKIMTHFTTVLIIFRHSLRAQSQGHHTIDPLHTFRMAELSRVQDDPRDAFRMASGMCLKWP